MIAPAPAPSAGPRPGRPLDSAPVRVALLGFGLIGGSIARALAAHDRRWQLTAWSPSGTGTRDALRHGVIAARAPDPETALRGAELVVLAAPPLVNLELVDRVAPLLAGGDCTLSDVSSVQGAIQDRAARHPRLHFVGGHPMSGRERAGYGASTAALFRARPWAVVPGAAARPVDVARVRAVALACGAEPIEVGAAEHDAAVAGISHLPLLASVALVESVAGDEHWELASRLAAQGWRDTTRLARGDAALGAGILTANAPAISARLQRYRAALDRWQGLLDGLAEPPVAPSDRLDRAPEIRERLRSATIALGESRLASEGEAG